MNNENDAIAKTEIESVESIQLAKDIKELFGYCKETYGSPTESRIVELKINNYEKETGKKFAETALAKVETSDKKNQKSYEDLIKLTDVNEVRTKGEESKTQESIIKRAQAAVKLKTLSDEEKTAEVKRLLEIIDKSSLSLYNETSDNDYQKINKDVSDLEAYIKASDTDKKGVARKKLDSLDTYDQRHSKNDDKKDQNTNNKTPFFRTGWGIVTIIAIVVVVFGAIAYFIKTNSSEEGE
ncbi:7785_t:CDS:2, partial [Scutellospora calospora]